MLGGLFLISCSRWWEAARGGVVTAAELLLLRPPEPPPLGLAGHMRCPVTALLPQTL